ncbi:MAG: hypothetical protein CMO81_01990 [Waddliaceae bacterium]|nr:hypothetical protein [Waddliaceae bacterium]
MNEKMLYLLALIWGFAEATLFFIIPDVFLSLIALKNLRLGIKACVWALIGALIGGLLMYFWAIWDYGGVLVVIEKIPAINQKMITQVAEEVNGIGIRAVFLGPPQGIPYKLYAIQSAHHGLSLIGFILASIPARGFRFLFVTYFSHFICIRVLKMKKPYIYLAMFWLGFYTWYFANFLGLEEVYKKTTS